MKIFNRKFNFVRWTVVISAVVAQSAVAAWPQPVQYQTADDQHAKQAPKERAVAIRGAAIETIAGDRIEKGNIVVRDGKIEAVGLDVEIPDDARVIEAEGMTVMPGIIDPFSRTGGVTGGGEFVKVADQFYPYQKAFGELLPYGITNLSITPSSLGQTAAIAITPDRPKTMVINADGNLFLPITNSTASLRVLRDGLALRPAAPSTQGPEIPPRAGRARGQRRGRDQQQQQRQRAGQRAGQQAPAQQSSMADPLWAKIAKGEQYVVINAANSATILYLGRILEKYPEVKVALNTTGSTVFETIDTLKKFKPLLILPPRIDNQPNRQYRINAARIAHEAGLEVAFTGLKLGAGGAATTGRGGRGAVTAPTRGATAVNRDVPLFPVAYLVKAGLPRKVALESLTLKPAQVMGLADRLGSIEEKKDANLLIFYGDPLDPAGRLLKVMVEGKFVYEK